MPSAARQARKSFTAELERLRSGLGWTIARIPFDVNKSWPVRKRLRVHGEIEGFAFRTSLFPFPGGDGHFLLVNKKMQAGAKEMLAGAKKIPAGAKKMQAGGHARTGARVRIWLEPDLDERTVLLPPELARELNRDRTLRRWYDSMSESMRREIGKWADEPKTPESRLKRAEKMAERLMQAMEGEEEPPPVLRAAFLRQPQAREGWLALTPTQRRNHLLGIFYYETADARERRAAKAVEDALRAAKRVSARPKP